MPPRRLTKASHQSCVVRPVSVDLQALVARDSTNTADGMADLPPRQQQQARSPSPRSPEHPQSQQRTRCVSVLESPAVEPLANAPTARSPAVSSSDSSSDSSGCRSSGSGSTASRSDSTSATPQGCSSLPHTRTHTRAHSTPRNDRTADAQQTHADSTRKRRQKTPSTAERRRLEILALRAQAIELEHTLAQLRAGDGPGDRDHRRRSSDRRLVAAAPNTDVGECVWRFFADDALERLAHSQQTNDRLKARVLEQKQRAKSLRRVLRRRAAQIAIVKSTVMRPVSTLSARLLSGVCEDERVLASLFVHTPAMYSETNAVVQYLQHCASPSSPSSLSSSSYGLHRRWQVRATSSSFAQTGGSGDVGDARLALEMVERYDVPFAIELVSDVLQHMTAKRVTGSAYSAHAPPLACEVARMVSSVQFRHTTAMGSGSSRLRQAASVFVEPTRCVLVYNSVIDSVTRTGEPIRDSFVMSERKWVVLTRVCEDSARDSSADTRARPSAAKPMTRIETLMRIEPTRSSSHKFLQEWRRDVVERVMIPAWDVGVAAHSQQLENRLVAAASSVVARG